MVSTRFTFQKVLDWENDLLISLNSDDCSYLIKCSSQKDWVHQKINGRFSTVCTNGFPLESVLLYTEDDLVYTYDGDLVSTSISDSPIKDISIK